MSRVTVMLKALPHGYGLEAPAYATKGAAAFDLRAAINQYQDALIEPGQAHTIPTGLAFAIPEGYAGLVLSRSGLAANDQVAITNAPGLIDSDYRGEVVLLLENRGRYLFRYKRGDRLAQMLVLPIPQVRFMPVLELPDTARGTGGLGSTGLGEVLAPGFQAGSKARP
jgi:dUTP pyrophosphatase